MIKVANWKIRTCLLAGFIATAAMTLLAGVTGVVSLFQIEDAVVGSTSSVSGHVEEQSSQLRYSLAIEHLRDSIQVAETIADIDQVKIEFDQLADVNSELTNDLKTSFSRLINLRRDEIALSYQSAELTRALDASFDDLYKKISSLADDVTFDSILAVEDAVTKMQHTSDGMTMQTSNDLADISTDIQTAISQSKASLTIGVLGHKLDAFYKNVLLSSDPAYVDYAGKAVKSVYTSIASELESLPSHDARELAELINETQEASNRLLEKRKAFLIKELERIQENESVVSYTRAFNNVALVNAKSISGKINSTLSKVTTMTHKYSAILLITSIVAFTLAVVIGVYIPRTIGINIAHIIEGVNVISSGNLTQELQNDSANEFGQLAKGFNGMVINLRGILAKIQDATGQITTSGSKILAASEQQAAGTREQSAAVSQTTSAASELSKTSEQIGNNVQSVSKMAKHVLVGMENIKEATNQTNDILTSLNDKSKQIGNITELIDDIADQTNLLAVNASIEAARAGEQGRGFTVVADQISKLADSTAKSTKDITSLIELIQNEMSNAIIAMEQSLKGVESEIELAQEAADKSQEIAMSANQQISGSKQIADAMNNIDDTMKQIANSAQMSAASVKELTTLADELKDSIKGFKVADNAV